MKWIYYVGFFIAIAGFWPQQMYAQDPVIPAAERTERYLPWLQNKKIGVFANHTSLVGRTHLIDTLLKRGVDVRKIFSPEHGFRGQADAGEKVVSGKLGNIPLVSLYGKNLKPKPEDLQDLDMLIFDIQDVGVRFYTYISSLQYFLEAALENHKPILILDRPNPNGFYVDGPVLDADYSSFVGLQPIPIVYGMTMGEYAMMLAGEGWLSEKARQIHAWNIQTEPSVDTPFHIQVLKCLNYDHKTRYELPVFPSPNLKDMASVYYYPSTCLFEGTVISEGRGTDHPFTMFGHPLLPATLDTFTPRPNAGAKTGKWFHQTCYGIRLPVAPEKALHEINNRVQLKWLLEIYRSFPQKDSFFLQNGFFNKLAGNAQLREQIVQGIPEKDIRKSWEAGIDKFKAIRKKYLIYTDFD